MPKQNMHNTTVTAESQSGTQQLRSAPPCYTAQTGATAPRTLPAKILRLASLSLMAVGLGAVAFTQTGCDKEEKPQSWTAKYDEGKKKWGLVDKKGNFKIQPQYDEEFKFEDDLAKVKRNGKYGFINVNGDFNVPAIYDSVSNFTDWLLIVSINDKYGLVDIGGDERAPLKYDYLCSSRSRSNEIGIFRLGEKYGLINTKGKEIVPPKYDDIENFDNNEKSDSNRGHLRVKLNGKWGLLDNTGREIVPLKYDFMHEIKDGLAVVRIGENYGYIDSCGNIAIPLTLDRAWYFVDGIAKMKFKGKWGYANTKGETVVPFKYDNVGPFSEGLVDVYLNGKGGFVDKTGKEIIPLKYDDADPCIEGLIKVKLNGKYGFIDKTGKEVIPIQYEDVWPFHKGVAWVCQNGNWSCINKEGLEVIPKYYAQEKDSFSHENLKYIAINKRHYPDSYGEGVIDKNNNVFIPPVFSRVCSGNARPYFKNAKNAISLTYEYQLEKTSYPVDIEYLYVLNESGGGITFQCYEFSDYSFGNNFLPVREHETGKWAFLDTSAKIIVPPKYDAAKELSDGLAAVRLGGKYGFIDKTGKEIIPLQFDNVFQSFKDGIAIVEINGKRAKVDKTGKIMDK